MATQLDGSPLFIVTSSLQTLKVIGKRLTQWHSERIPNIVRCGGWQSVHFFTNRCGFYKCWLDIGLAIDLIFVRTLARQMYLLSDRAHEVFSFNDRPCAPHRQLRLRVCVSAGCWSDGLGSFFRQGAFRISSQFQTENAAGQRGSQ